MTPDLSPAEREAVEAAISAGHDWLERRESTPQERAVASHDELLSDAHAGFACGWLASRDAALVQIENLLTHDMSLEKDQSKFAGLFVALSHVQALRRAGGA